MIEPGTILRAAIALAIAGGVALAFLYGDELQLDRIEAVIAAGGPLMPAAYLAAHVLASLFFFPRTFMAILAGVVFGAWWGPILSLAGSLLGSYIGFMAARYVNAGRIRPEEMRRIGPWLKRAEASGWRAIAVFRVLPIPHTPTNYAFGVTQVRLRDFMLGSLFGFMPASFVCAQLGASGRHATIGTGDVIELTLWGAAFVTMVILLPRLAERWSQG